MKYDYFEMKIVQPKGHIIVLSRFKAKSVRTIRIKVG